MKKKMKLAVGLATVVALSANMIDINTTYAASPLPLFEKEALDDTYRRTGDQEPVIEDKNHGLSQEHLGNTGTVDKPAFYVEKVNLTGFMIPGHEEIISRICAKYEKKNLDIEKLHELQNEVGAYIRAHGYTVSQVVIPPQEVKDGELELKVYVATYDTIAKVTNPDVKEDRTDIAESILDKYIHEQLIPGHIIKDVEMERALNTLNDLPGVSATARLKPGSQAGTTSVDIEIKRRPVWNNYVFVDNGGSYSTGKYRYGFHAEWNNPGNQGDKIMVSGMKSSGDLWGGSIGYEFPVGYWGTRMGIVLSQNEYDAIDNGNISKGRSTGFSYYGLTPLYRDRAHRIHAIWGYDHRMLESDVLGWSNIPGVNKERKAHSNVIHAGITGSEYEKDSFTNYSVIGWYGNATEEKALGLLDSKTLEPPRTSASEGSFFKLTAEVNHVKRDHKASYHIKVNGQMANRYLDSSERFYAGGMNSVRAYDQSTTSGDAGIYWLTELRYKVFDVEGLTAAVFYEGANVANKEFTDVTLMNNNRTIHGWGLGFRYDKPNDWHVQLDYARKMWSEDDIDTRSNAGRWWFQAYKMF